MADFEYAILSDPDVAGFFTGPVDALGNFLSEEIAKVAAAERRRELQDIKRLRGVIGGKRRRGNIAASTYERGLAILDARQEALERVDQPAAVTMPEPLSPYSSPMMDALPLALEPSVASTPVQPRYGSRFTPRKVAKDQGALFYFSTRPCARGHLSKRFTASANCAACLDIYRAVNIDKVRKHSRDSHQRRRDRAKQTEYSAQI